MKGWGIRYGLAFMLLAARRACEAPQTGYLEGPQ